MTDADVSTGTAVSKVEGVKEASDHLRGDLAADLASDAASFSADNQVLLKFHGIYQQDDRDVRSARTRAKQELDYLCMVRTAVPGGVLTADQYLAMDDLATLGNGTLRITVRQGSQFHFLRKGSLRPLLSALDEKLVTTLGACGDLVRNVTCCPAPLEGRATDEVQYFARALATRLRPRTNAYYEVWIDGERAITAPAPTEGGMGGDVEEPLYGATYLPRKFKIGLAWPGDNCIDVYTQDVGIVPVLAPAAEGGALRAFVLLVGGGLGKSHTDDTTFPRLASPLCTVAPDELVDVVEEIVKLQRDHGNRTEREHARLKYLVEAWGVPRFRAEMESRLGRALADPQPLEWSGADDHLGWGRADDGTWFLGVGVLAGRISDGGLSGADDGVGGAVRVKSGLRAVVERFGCGVRFTPRQDLLLTGFAEEDRPEVHRLLREHDITLADDVHGLDRAAMACPALPTCGLALTEAERVLPEVLAGFHAVLDAAGLAGVDPHLRMTGCPNGCSRPYTAEVGIVGRGKKGYDLHLGGDVVGTRLNEVFAENVPKEQLGPVLAPLLEHYRDAAGEGERFGDFCAREGVGSLRARFGNESWVRKGRAAAVAESE